LKNKLEELSEKNREIKIFNLSEESVKPFLIVAISNLVYNHKNNFGPAISFLGLIIEYTKKEYLELYEKKLLGPLIRVLNYRIE
jgi:hypothetical protein